MTSTPADTPIPHGDGRALRVTVAVTTYRRPERLAVLLDALLPQAAQVTAQGVPGAADVRVRVLVVDNDAAGSAQDVVAAAARKGEGGAVGVDGVVESAPGISAARNRALTESAEEDVLVFVDDDEVPEPGWLAVLLGAWAAERPAAVAAPVVQALPGPDAFLEGGRFFELPRYETGDEIEESGSGNLLLDVAFLTRHGLRFDPEYGITGGEDTKLCRDLRAAGGRIVWCDEAVVREPVVAERATRAFVGRRTFRQGSGWARLRLEETPAGLPRVTRALGYAGRGAAKAARGGALLGVARLRRDEAAEGAAAREALGGLGIAAAAAGLRVDGYRRPTPLADLDVRAEPSLARPRPVTVGVPTFRREDQLADLLDALVPQLLELRDATAGEDSRDGTAAVARPVRLVVVDNSPEGSARPLVEEVARRAQESSDDGAEALVHYVHEVRPGVVHVRNTILDHALRDGYLACIDDDEVPAPGWLVALVAAGERSGAAAVSGRVEYELGAQAEPWVALSGHFAAPEREPGQRLPGASTANLLLDLYQLRLAGLRFDTGYALTGGEDTRLTRDVQLAGGTVVAAPDAVTHEAVPPERATRAWVLKRAERNAESWARVRADVRPGEGVVLPAARAPQLGARAAVRAVKGLGKYAAARRSGEPAAIAEAELYLAGAKGLARGALGINREEYGRS